MITCQHEFVDHCQSLYKKLKLEPGNPLHGDWHKAHYPTPKCLGGCDWIWLLPVDHAVQGVLQSIEFEHRCVYSWERKFIPADYLPLYLQAMGYVVDHRPSPKNTKWINNGEEQRRWRGGDIPKGWQYGRLPVKWITNGIDNKMIPKITTIPEGWRIGRAFRNPTEGKKWINNGLNNKLIFPDEQVPEGWFLGMIK